MYNGLVYCTAQQFSGSSNDSTFCIIKAIEVACTLLLLLFIIWELVQIWIIKRRFAFGFIVSVCLMMMLSLLFNMFFALFHSIFLLLYFEIFFANFYLLVVFSYVGYNIVQKGIGRILVHIIVLLFGVFFTAIFINRVVTQLRACKEVWFLVVDVMGLILSIMLFAIFLQQQRIQKQKQSILYTSQDSNKKQGNEAAIFTVQDGRNNKSEDSQKQQVKQAQASDKNKQKEQLSQRRALLNENKSIVQNNPFIYMWVMILANIVSQISNLIQTILYQVLDNGNCGFSNATENRQSTNLIIQFVFVVFGYYLGFIAALFTFNRKRRSKQLIIDRIKRKYNQTRATTVLCYNTDLASVQNQNNKLQILEKSVIRSSLPKQ